MVRALLAWFCVSGVMCPRPAKMKKRKREKERKRKSHQKRPDRARPSDRCAIRSPGVSCRSFCLQSSCRFFYSLVLTLRFCFRQLDNPSWFRHRGPWPHLFTRDVMRFPPPRQGLHASCVPDLQILLEGPWACHSLYVGSLERSPVVTWDSIMKFLKHRGRPIHASFDSSSHRGRRAPLRKRKVEANRKIQR